MAKKTQRNFSSGEISPDLFGRSDFVSYKTGLKTLRNAYVRRHGSIERRPGTKFSHRLKEPGARLIPFTFSRDISYVLELGNNYVRIFENGEPFLKLDSSSFHIINSITDVTNEVNPLFTQIAHGFSVGDEFYVELSFASETRKRQLYTVSEVVDANSYRVVDFWGNQLDTTSSGLFGASVKPEEILTLETDFTSDQVFDVRYTQIGDVVTLTHKDVGVYDISRVGDNLIPESINWEIEKVYFYPDVGVPAVAQATPFPSSTDPILYSYRYYATVISPETGKESLAGKTDVTNVNQVGPDNKITIEVFKNASVLPVPDLINVYRLTFDSASPPGDFEFAGVGFMGTFEMKTVGAVVSRKFVDDGSIVPDTSKAPPLPGYVYGDTINYSDITQNETDLSFYDSFIVNDHPNAIATSKGRRYLGGSDNERDVVKASALSQFETFDEPYIGTTNATSALEFFVTTEVFGRIQHLVDWKRLFVFTDVAEFVAQGGENGSISAVDLPNTEKISENGANNLRPLIAEKSVVYCQARGSLVRAIGGSISRDNYSGDELSIFSSHLVDGYELIDWTYQRTPHGIIWAVRDDGVLLSLTYNENQEIKGWARHDFLDGKAKSICTVSEGVFDRTYVVVERTINNQTVNYIESFDTREIVDDLEYVFTDSSFVYDGRNTNTSHTMTLTDPLFEYVYTNPHTLTSSVAYFESTDVGQSIFIYNAEGDVLRCEITAFTSSTEVTVSVPKDTSLFLVPTSTWSKALKTVTGLDHLEREKITAYGDGFVKASELNESYNALTVINGQIEFDEPSAVFSIGKAYIVDVEPLEIDMGSEIDSTEDEKFNPNYVVMRVGNSGSVFVGYKQPQGNTVEGLRETKLRRYENYEEPIHLRTGIMELNIEATFTEEGRVFIRQIDPLPLKILSIGVSGEI